jgi:hypothetical protein
MKLQKIGGFGSIASALIGAMALVIVGLFFPRLGLVGPGDRFDPIKGINAESASPIVFILFNLDLILWGMAFILIILALRERMQANAPNLMRIAVIGVATTYALMLAAGLIGILGMPSIVTAKDVFAYRALMGVYFGLMVGGDHAAGWAVLLIGWAALKTRSLPRILGYLSVLVGIVFIIEFAAKPLMPVGLFLSILWGAWLGAVLLRSKS